MAMSTAASITIEQAVQAVKEALAERGSSVYDVVEGTSLKDLGLDSMELAELFMALEDLTGARLDPDSAEDVELVRDLTHLRPL